MPYLRKRKRKNRPDNKTSKGIGDNAEKLARNFLVEKGLKIVANNYRCKAGEIDLIAIDKGYLVFVEVRYRQNDAFGTPAETVSNNKQNRLIRAAKHFLLQCKTIPPCRFDVIAIQQNSNTNWIKNAFLTD